ncbi:type I restriction enzyme HsdR N-terminal domain-containing protein [Desulfosporosinus burensis]
MKTESDVEQKFIYQFLTNSSPMGLGFRPSDIQTKQILRQYLIGKGKQKYYYPDYLIAMRGIPLLVIEAKAPGGDLVTAYSEARLYAVEVNAAFPHNVNVCSKIVVSNGTETWAGYFDQAEPELKLSFEEFQTESKSFVEILKFCSKDELLKVANRPYIESRGRAIFNTPVSELGGKRVQDEELVENTYGRTLVFENRNIFDPETEEDRVGIVKNAYILSSKREQHIEPMYKEIKKIKLPSEVNTTLISTDEPAEIVDKLNKHIILHEQTYSLMLLIGNVGSGKTTFIRYFKEIVLKEKYKELSNKSEWIFVNMNPAPLNRDEIYSWIKTKIIAQIKINYKEINFTNIETIKKLFKREISDFEHGIGQILKNNEDAYSAELFKMLQQYTQDNETILKAILGYLKETKNKVPIIVFDNCDKRNKDAQLLMFEVAQWIRESYKCIVILPMRDSTYDTYKNEKPLDTVVKDLVFRIDTADLLKVLQARLEYIYRLRGTDQVSYSLEKGINVVVKNKEQIEYFKCILLSIRKNRWIADIFYKLTNRNIRDGIQLFEDFCKSGHIKSEDILMIRTAKEDSHLPAHKIINALLRKNRRYYSDEKSNFANLFSAKFEDDFPDPFVRVDILRWLKKYIHEEGPNRVQGYHKVDRLIRALQTIGHNEVVIYREIKSLIKRGLIFSEIDFSEVDYCDLIKLSPSGTLHLNLLGNISYLGACAEDVIYKNPQIMTSISRRIAMRNYLEKLPVMATAKDMIDYLKKYRGDFLSQPEVYLKDEECFSIYDLKECMDTVDNMMLSDSSATKAIDISSKYQRGTQLICKVISKRNYSLLCLFDNELRGFLATFPNKYQLSNESYISINEGDELLCQVIEYDYKYASFQLEFLKKVDREF